MSDEHQIRFLVRELREAGTAARRAAAAKGLGRLGRREHVHVLLDATYDVSAVREAAAIGLGRLGVVSAGDRLIELLDDPDARVRRRALLASERLELSGPPLETACLRLLSDADEHVRLNALTTLRRVTGPEGLKVRAEAIVRMLGDPYRRVADYALFFVRHWGDEVTDVLLRVARDDDPWRRAGAMNRLAELERTPEAHEIIAVGLADPEPAARRAAARWLAAHWERSMAGTLLGALERERDDEARTDLLRALGRSGDRRGLPHAVRALDDPVVGWAAVQALTGIGTREAVAALRSVLARGRGPVGQAARALGTVGGRDDVAALAALLGHEAVDVRLGAVRGLSGLLDRGGLRRRRGVAVRALLGVLAHDGAAVWPAIGALRAELPRVLPEVRRVADEGTGENRAAALWLLPDDEGDRFLTALDDPDESVRYHAALGAGRFLKSHDVPEFESRLAALVEDASPRVRQAAVEALKCHRSQGVHLDRPRARRSASSRGGADG
ncbi:HEAT repeat domain-containing protein [Spirillospora sp. CA-294931]|uniref:HEAT repeat domain-containing protein n=1 Tax=Spirillospora sp. CA-294931 TaxID=3240042 RepID=UPI003D8D4ECA